MLTVRRLQTWMFGDPLLESLNDLSKMNASKDRGSLTRLAARIFSEQSTF